MWRTGTLSLLDEFYSSDMKSNMPMAPPGLDGFKQVIQGFRAGLHDMTFTVDDLVAEGDRVASRITWTASHKGDLMGIPATGKKVTVSEMHIYRISNGKIVERWGEVDMMGMMQQLGVIPSQGK